MNADTSDTRTNRSGKGAAASTGSAKRGRGRPTLSNEELLDRALTLFLEQGFEGASMDAITAAAGVAKRTVYQRYGDKESLFKAALERAIEEWIVPVERLHALECEDLERTLRDIARVLIRNIMTPAGLRLLKITNAEAGRRPDISVFTYEHGTRQTILYLADLFRRRIGPAAGPIDDWEEAAIAFLNSVVSGPPTKTAWGLSFDDESVERHIVFTVRLFIFGLMPRDAQAGVEAGPKSGLGESARAASLSDAPVPAGHGSAASGVRMRELEEENRTLRKLLVDTMLENVGLENAGGRSPASG